MGVGYIGEIAPLDRPGKAIFSLRVAARQGGGCAEPEACVGYCARIGHIAISHTSGSHQC